MHWILALLMFITLVLLIARGVPATGHSEARAQNLPPLPSVKVNGVELHYVEEGKGPPVILVHGSLADYKYWELSDQISLLAERHRIIAYSRRYNYPNRNLREGDHSPMVEALDLWGLVEELSLGPVHLVGHSYGAYAALMFALEHPEKVRTLVLAEPPIISWLPEIPGGEGIYERFMERVWHPLARAFSKGGTHAGLDFTARWYFQLSWEEIEADWQVLFGRNAEEWHALAMSEYTFPKVNFERVREITTPTLLLSGGSNQGFNKLIDSQLEQLLPNVKRVIIPGASHEMFLDARTHTATAILEFINQN